MRKQWNKFLNLIIVIFVGFLVFSEDVRAAGSNLSTATEIEVGKRFYGQLCSNSQNDYYKFTISKNSIIKIEAKTDGHEESCCIYLYDSDGKNVKGGYFCTTDDYANWGYQSGTEQAGLNAGTYYLRVLKNYGPNSNYNIKLSSVVKSSSTVKVAGQKNEYLSKALKFSVGNKLASVATNGFNGMDWDDCHYYKFKVAKKRTVILKFNTPVTEDNNTVWFYVYNSSGKVISSMIDCDSVYGENNAKFEKVLPAGTYYISACTPDWDIRYTIKTAYKPYATKITKLTPAKKKITVKWNSKSNITGYEIQYSRNSNFSNSKKIKVSANKTQRVIKGLKANKKYYVRVRTYKKAFGTTYYSTWSTKKNIKTK